MRTMVQPLPSLHCNHCDGELRFKAIEPSGSALDIDVQIFVCTKCGREHLREVVHDYYAAHGRSAMPPVSAAKRGRSGAI